MTDELAARGSMDAAGMSVTATSRKIGLSRSTVQRRLRKQQWPGGRSGRKWLVSTPFVHAAAAQLTASAHVDLDAFAAAWMARATPPQSAVELAG